MPDDIIQVLLLCSWKLLEPVWGRRAVNSSSTECVVFSSLNRKSPVFSCHQFVLSASVDLWSSFFVWSWCQTLSVTNSSVEAETKPLTLPVSVRFFLGLTPAVKWSGPTSWMWAGRQITASSTEPPCVASPTCGGSAWRTRLAWCWTLNKPGEDEDGAPADHYSSSLCLRSISLLEAFVFPRSRFMLPLSKAPMGGGEAGLSVVLFPWRPLTHRVGVSLTWTRTLSSTGSHWQVLYVRWDDGCCVCWFWQKLLNLKFRFDTKIQFLFWSFTECKSQAESGSRFWNKTRCYTDSVWMWLNEKNKTLEPDNMFFFSLCYLTLWKLLKSFICSSDQLNKLCLSAVLI